VVIPVDAVDDPRGPAREGYQRIELVLTQRCVQTIGHTQAKALRSRLQVSVIGQGASGKRCLHRFLSEQGHLVGCVGLVEGDHVRQTRHIGIAARLQVQIEARMELILEHGVLSLRVLEFFRRRHERRVNEHSPQRTQEKERSFEELIRRG